MTGASAAQDVPFGRATPHSSTSGTAAPIRRIFLDRPLADPNT